jgi:hypothetical protein
MTEQTVVGIEPTDMNNGSTPTFVQTQPTTAIHLDDVTIPSLNQELNLPTITPLNMEPNLATMNFIPTVVPKAYRDRNTRHDKGDKVYKKKGRSSETEGKQYPVFLAFSNWPLSNILAFIKQYVGIQPATLSEREAGLERRPTELGIAPASFVEASLEQIPYVRIVYDSTGGETNRSLIVMSNRIYQNLLEAGFSHETKETRQNFRVKRYEPGLTDFPRKGFGPSIAVEVPQELQGLTRGVESSIGKRLKFMAGLGILAPDSWRVIMPMTSRREGRGTGKCFISFQHGVPLKDIVMTRLLLDDSLWDPQQVVFDSLGFNDDEILNPLLDKELVFNCAWAENKLKKAAKAAQRNTTSNISLSALSRLGALRTEDRSGARRPYQKGKHQPEGVQLPVIISPTQTGLQAETANVQIIDITSYPAALLPPVTGPPAAFTTLAPMVSVGSNMTAAGDAPQFHSAPAFNTLRSNAPGITIPVVPQFSSVQPSPLPHPQMPMASVIPVSHMAPFTPTLGFISSNQPVPQPMAIPFTNNAAQNPGF